MDRPALPDMSRLVTSAMTMRDSANVILDINDNLAANPAVTTSQHIQQAKDMRQVVEMQQGMIEHMLEKYMQLADMTDSFFTQLDATLKKFEKE